MTLDDFCTSGNMFKAPLAKDAAEWLLRYQRCIATCGVVETGNGRDDSLVVHRVMLSKVDVDLAQVPESLRDHMKSSEFIAVREREIPNGASTTRELWLSGFLKLKNSDGRSWRRQTRGQEPWLIEKGSSFFIDVDQYLDRGPAFSGLPPSRVIQERELFFSRHDHVMPDPKWRVVRPESKFRPGSRPSSTPMATLLSH